MTRPDIAIPAELLPADGRFGSGPSRVRPEAIAALVAAAPTYLGTSHRQEAVRSVVRRIREGLARLFALPDGYEVLLGTGGATLVFDAVGWSFIERRSQHLVFGEFSAKFAESVGDVPHLEPPEIVEAPPGERAEPRPSDVDVYAITQNETSTGVAVPVRRPAPDGLVVVDAVSAAGGTLVDPEDFDVYFFSPQKCFAADAGLWVAVCSPAAVERIERVGTAGRTAPAVLDLRVALENARKDQTLNTPPLASLFLLADSIEWMLGNGGLAWAAGRCDRSSETIYGWADRSSFATPFVADPDARSHTIATIDFDPSVDAAMLAATLRANGIVDVEPYRKLARNQLRIALFPAIDPSDVEALSRCIDFVVEARA